MPCAQTQPRTVAGGLRPHPSKTGPRPEPGLEQLESAEQIDSFGEIDCGFYLESYVRCTYLFFMMICLFSARLDFLVPILSKIVPLRIRVKTLITIGFIYCLSILLALFKKKVVPPLQANNINRFQVFGTIFEYFFKEVFIKLVFDF